MTYNSKESEVAFRTGREWAKNKILDLVGAEIDAFLDAANDSSRTPTDRILQRCFAEITGMLKEKIEALEFDD